MATSIRTERVAPNPSAGVVPISSEEAWGVTFEQSPLAWRGYSEDGVDTFVTRAAHTLAMAERERKALRAEIERLRYFYRENGTNVDRAPGHPGVKLSVPSRATPNHATDRAKQHAAVALTQADACAELVLSGSQKKAEDLLQHATVRARIAIEEDLVHAMSPSSGDPRDGYRDLEQLAQWLRAFSEAVWIQVDAMRVTVETALDQLVGEPGAQPRGGSQPSILSRGGGLGE